MHKIISETNLNFVRHAISKVSSELRLANMEKSLWVIYGSYVINANNDKSDLDILCICKEDIPIDRAELEVDGISVHLTLITMEMFRADGIERKFGSYFTGKVLNPHIFLFGDSGLKNEVMYYTGSFISPLAGYISSLSRFKAFKPSQLTAIVFIAYLSTDPSFESYFLSYYSCSNFSQIWDSLCDETLLTLSKSKSVTQVGNRFKFNFSFRDYKDFNSERIKVSARHWAYAAVSHGSDYTFQDKIYSKASDKMAQLDPSGRKYKKMVKFLEDESGLQSIHI